MKIAFYKSTRPGIQGVFNRLVRWWTNGPYSHCEAVLEEQQDGFSLCASSSFIDGGVRLKPIQLDPDHWDVVEIDADPLAAQRWFNNNQGKKYDSLGLMGFIWRRADGHKKKWFCSEAVAASINFIEPWRFDPNALAAVLKTNNTRG